MMYTTVPDGFYFSTYKYAYKYADERNSALVCDDIETLRH